jgi:hypothetical protein
MRALVSAQTLCDMRNAAAYMKTGVGMGVWDLLVLEFRIVISSSTTMGSESARFRAWTYRVSSNHAPWIATSPSDCIYCAV